MHERRPFSDDPPVEPQYIVPAAVVAVVFVLFVLIVTLVCD